MNSSQILCPLALLAAGATALVGLGAPASSAPSDDFPRSYFGDGNLPARCIVDRDPINPDNECYHMKVGLNALDDPQIDVAILAPVSPVVERDLRVAEQAVQMWGEGVDYLADEMGLDWLADGVDMNITTHELVVDPAGLLTEPLDLVDPEIVVIMSNPAGGIGIGIVSKNRVFSYVFQNFVSRLEGWRTLSAFPFWPRIAADICRPLNDSGRVNVQRIRVGAHLLHELFHASLIGKLTYLSQREIYR